MFDGLCVNCQYRPAPNIIYGGLTHIQLYPICFKDHYFNNLTAADKEWKLH